MKKKFKIATLGCRTNQYESGAYAYQLKHLGLEEAGAHEKADICIVNTCTVTESADKKNFYQIRKLHEENPEAKILVTGCMAERQKDEIASLPGVFQVVGNPNKETLLKDLFPQSELPEFRIDTFPGHTRAFVKIQDGCNSFCSYCILPYVRGRSKSRAMDEVLEEMKGLIASGYQEIVLTGINIGDFDGGKKRGEKKDRLADLVRKADKLKGLKRLRISSIDPDEVDEELLDAVLEGKTTCPSMHIVLQSGSNAILKRMNRKYTRADFYKAVEKATRAKADFTFTTDVIVGFPGETDKDFEETLEVVETVKFAKVHVFPYSRRPMTRADRFEGHLPREVISERKRALIRKSEEAALNLREGYVGKKARVLLETEDPERPGYFQGYSEHFLHVSVNGCGLEANRLVQAACIANEPAGLIAEAYA